MIHTIENHAFFNIMYTFCNQFTQIIMQLSAANCEINQSTTVMMEGMTQVRCRRGMGIKRIPLDHRELQF